MRLRCRVSDKRGIGIGSRSPASLTDADVSVPDAFNQAPTANTASKRNGVASNATEPRKRLQATAGSPPHHIRSHMLKSEAEKYTKLVLKMLHLAEPSYRWVSITFRQKRSMLR